MWKSLNLSVQTLRRISALLHTLFEPALTEPPITNYQGQWQTWVRVDIIRFLESWSPHIKGRVLDVGGGTWRIPRELLAGKCEYLVVDKLEHPNVDINADIHHLTDRFEPNSFDWLLCLDVFEHVANPADVAEQLHAVLKPGAKLLLTTPFNFHLHGVEHFPDLWRITEQGLRRILSMFSDVQIEPTGAARFPRSYLVVATK